MLFTSHDTKAFIFQNFQDDIALRRALTRAKLLKRRATEEDAGARIIAQINATSPTEEESVNGTTGAGMGTCFNDVMQRGANLFQIGSVG